MLRRPRTALPRRFANRLTQFFAPSTVRRAAHAACQPLEQRLLLSAWIDTVYSQTIAEGSSVNLAVHVHNTSDDGSPAPDLEIYADYGDGTGEVLGTAPDGGADLYFAHAYADDGAYTVRLTNSSAYVETDFNVEAVDVSPDMRLGGPNFASLNRTYTLELFHADPGADPLDHWNIDWGDNTSSTVPGDATTATHVYTQLCPDLTIRANAVEADTGLIGPTPPPPATRSTTESG